MSTSNAPPGRSGHTAVWTGSEMIVWGGQSTTGGFLSDVGRYNPAADTWTLMSTSGAPPGRSGHTAVWTGSEMIIWGGSNSSGLLNETWSYAPPRTMYLYRRL